MTGGPAPDQADERIRRLAEWDRDALESLADEYGTPLYVADLDRVRENYRRFAAAFPDAEVMYAAKANTCRAVLSALVDEGAPIECAAAGEVQRAIEAGADPNDIQYTGVNPPDPDLDYVVEQWEDAPGLTVNVGAEDSVERLAERGFDGPLCLRVNPGIGLGHHEKVATGSHPKFGIPYDRVPEVADRAREVHGCDLVGLHAHVGSGILDADELDAHRRFVARMSDLAERVGVEFVDIGGGFGVPYEEERAPLDLAAAAENTREAFEAAPRLVLEPGRYVVADAGLLLARTNTVKETPETTVVGVDASMTTLIRPALYDAYHPVRNVTSPESVETAVTVGGPVCESSDVFCTDRPLPLPERGDLLAVGLTGAYGYEMASQFHSQPRPAEVSFEDGSVRVTRERETVDDITRVERP